MKTKITPYEIIQACLMAIVVIVPFWAMAIFVLAM